MYDTDAKTHTFGPCRDARGRAATKAADGEDVVMSDSKSFQVTTETSVPYVTTRQARAIEKRLARGKKPKNDARHAVQVIAPRGKR